MNGFSRSAWTSVGFLIRKAREEHVAAPFVDHLNEGFVQRFFLSHARDLPRAIFEQAVNRTVVADQRMIQTGFISRERDEANVFAVAAEIRRARFFDRGEALFARDEVADERKSEIERDCQKQAAGLEPIDKAGCNEHKAGNGKNLIGPRPPQQQGLGDGVAFAHALLLTVNVAPRRADHRVERGSNGSKTLPAGGDLPIEIVAFGAYALDVVL